MSMNELTFRQVLPLIKADLQEGLTPALLGEPGIGKSSLIEDLARLNKTKVFTLPVNQLGDKTDLTGMRMTQSKEGNWRQESFPHSIIMDCIEYSITYPDENPILFLDEFNRATSDITSAILSFQTLRKIGDVTFPENMRIIVAGNDKGNVTSLDGASLSRFAVYRLIPDLDTFLSVQTLNPFIMDVLAKYPTDLMAPKLTEVVSTTDDASQNDDEDEELQLLIGLDAMGGDCFEQITRPRTITYTSQWLNALGINKSGDDTERTLLGSMFTNMSETGEGNVLLAGIEAHAGNTCFSQHLFDEIRSYFNSLINTAYSAGQPVLKDIRPKQDIINELSRAPGVVEIETLISRMTQRELINTMIWLNEGVNTKEINNNLAVKHYLINAPHSIEKFENDDLKTLISILIEPTKRSDVAIADMLSGNAPIMDQWRPVINGVI